MNKKIILRLSNEIGNQMFMYAAAYSISRSLNRDLYLDNETAFQLKKNISTYGLDEFEINHKIAPNRFKFLKFDGYLRRKFLLKLDGFKNVKKFYIEHKNKEKITYFDEKFLYSRFQNNLFIEGHFESEKYFHNYKQEIINEFVFKYKDYYSKNKFFGQISNSNSISICVRQDRFSEKLRKINSRDIKKSQDYSLEQINYIQKSIELIKSKVQNPKFFIWSNNFNNLEKYFPVNKFTHIKNNEPLIEGRRPLLDLFLMSQAKHFIVTPSSFNWWGAYLSLNPNKIIIRPDENNFSTFKINNLDFWPEKWIKI
jgi:hypothetical protein